MPRRSLFVCACAVMALTAVRCTPRKPPPPNEPPPAVGPAASEDPDEARLLGLAPGSGTPSLPEGGGVLGLRVGETLASTTIGAFLPVTDGRVPVLVRSSKGEGLLEIALRGDGPPAPATSEHFAVYWRRDPTRLLPGDALDAAAQALAARLKETERSSSPPPGMRPYGKERRSPQ